MLCLCCLISATLCMQQEPPPESIVGPPRFMANDFVIYDKLGSLNVRTVEQSSVQASLDETLRKGASTATITQKVNIYSATYESGKPFQGPVTVLLKEYTPETRQIGSNELLIAHRLQVCVLDILRNIQNPVNAYTSCIFYSIPPHPPTQQRMVFTC